jgi:hypothetical protein
MSVKVQPRVTICLRILELIWYEGNAGNERQTPFSLVLSHVFIGALQHSKTAPQSFNGSLIQ